MGCNRNPPTLSREKFIEAYKNGGWLEVFKKDPSLGKMGGLKTKLHAGLLLKSVVLRQKEKMKNDK